jgi:hypothetical protein
MQSLDFGGVQVAGPYTTPSGVDVLPGTYGFVLNFTDVNGAETQSQTLIFQGQGAQQRGLPVLPP